MALERSRNTFGLYTKTVVRSPVVLWILHAQIRHRTRNDVVFVGEDFIEVKEVGRDGHMQTVAVKDDFDGRIRAASVLSNDDDRTEEDFLVKLEKERTGFLDEGFSPQTLVLTLDSNDLVFIYLRTEDDGSPRFAEQSLPMPDWDRVLFQAGEFLAVDPYSRAIAVAANERNVILYASKPKDRTQAEMRSGSDSWCPVSGQRTLHVDGVIQQIAFLMPPPNDDDHIILLLIVTDHRKTKAVRIEWYHSSGPQDAQVYPGQSLESEKQVPSLLVPLPDSSFLLAIGSEVTRWKHILTGSVTGMNVIINPSMPSKYSGVSAHAPAWTGWARPRRNKGMKRVKDNIYLAREDGYVFWLNMSANGSLSSVLAADMECHVGSAFASLGEEDGPDILAVAGETSGGRVVSIGQWPSIRRLEELSRTETMDPETIEILPNWASATDMISTIHRRSDHNSFADAENVLVTSGRQPFGSVTEIRQGLELSLSALTHMDGLRNVNDIWTLPNVTDGSILAIFSFPDMTRLLSIPAAFDDDFEEVEAAAGFDLTRRTLAADITATGELVQVTESGFCVSSSLSANFEDTWKHQVDDSAITAAVIVSGSSFLVIAVWQDGEYELRGYLLPSLDSNTGIEQAFKFAIDARPLALHAVAVSDSIVVAISTEIGEVTMVRWSLSTSATTTHKRSLFPGSRDEVICDSLALLQGAPGDDSRSRLLAVCGLRDGTLITFMVDAMADTTFDAQHKLTLGVSSTKLVCISSDSKSVIAMSGAGTYLLTWTAPQPHSIAVEQVWVTDRRQPEFAQGMVTAVSQLPSAALLSSSVEAGSLVMTAGDNLLVGRLNRRPTAVPRQIPVSGTPNRLIYADAFKSYVCASLVAEVRLLASTKPHCPPEEKRQIWPVIEFIPRKGSQSSYSHHMQPGERVNALLEWSHTRGSDKRYSFVLVGGSYIRHTGTRRGRVSFLQCSLKNGEVAEAKELHKEPFDQDVSALALYDEATYIACAGERVYMLHYDDERWSQLCVPFKLASPASQMTTELDHSGRKVIVISTMRDTIVSLRLETALDNGSTSKAVLVPVSMGPKADSLLSHILLPTDAEPYTCGKIDQFALMSTRSGQLLGLQVAKTEGPATSRHRIGEIVFEAHLPRSLTRLIHSPPAKRKGDPPAGVVQQRIRGTAADGSLTSITLLHEDIWRRLQWLQRLIEWSEELSPHSYHTPVYELSGGQHGIRSRNRALPIGFAGGQDDVAIVHTMNSKENDMHIDGDVLSRVLRRGGAEAVRKVLHLLAEREDAIGTWVRGHLEEELTALDEVVDVVQKLDRWM